MRTLWRAFADAFHAAYRRRLDAAVREQLAREEEARARDAMERAQREQLDALVRWRPDRLH